MYTLAVSADKENINGVPIISPALKVAFSLVLDIRLAMR